MTHLCTDLCKRIAAEKAKGLTFAPSWNSLSHEEQAAWLAAKHGFRLATPFHRILAAAKVLIGLE